MADDCAHRYSVASIEGAGRARTLWLKCDKCGGSLARLTNRTDAEIAAELAAQ